MKDFLKRVGNSLAAQLPAKEHLKPYAPRVRPPYTYPAFWFVVPATALALVAYGFFFALTAPYLIVQFAFPLIALAGVTIWALPDYKRNPSGLIEGFLFAFLICQTLWPRYLALGLPGLPWITVARLTGIPLVLLIVISASISREFRTYMREVLNTTPAIWKLVCAFVLIQVLTLPLSNHPAFTLNRVINAQISWTAVFFSACFVFSKPGRAERWSYVLWACVIVVGAIGILENAKEHVIWVNYIPNFLKIEDESVQRILAGGYRMYGGGYRVQSTFTVSLGLAEFMALSLPFVLHFAAGNYQKPVRIFATITVPTMIYVVLLTDSRLGLLGAFTAFLSYTLLRTLIAWRRDKQNLLAPAVLFGFPALCIAAVASTFTVGRIRSRIWGGQYQSSNDGRMEQITSGIPKIIKQPIGYGMNNSGEVLGWVQPNGLMTIDVYYLATALDYGIIGFLVYYAIFICTSISGFSASVKSKKDNTEYSLLIPATISIINFIVIKAVFADESNHPLVFATTGMVIGLIYRIRTNDPKLGKSQPQGEIYT